jgi:hypothetical protein
VLAGEEQYDEHADDFFVGEASARLERGPRLLVDSILRAMAGQRFRVRD